MSSPRTHSRGDGMTVLLFHIGLDSGHDESKKWLILQIFQLFIGNLPIAFKKYSTQRLWQSPFVNLGLWFRSFGALRRGLFLRPARLSRPSRRFAAVACDFLQYRMYPKLAI